MGIEQVELFSSLLANPSLPHSFPGVIRFSVAPIPLLIRFAINNEALFIRFRPGVNSKRTKASAQRCQPGDVLLPLLVFHVVGTIDFGRQIISRFRIG
jgi:hypothetical protein